MRVDSKLDEAVVELLRRQGYRDRQIVRMSPDTELLRDLWLGGDSADELLEIMEGHFGVSFDMFYFSHYFPGEISWDLAAVRSLPFPWLRRRALSRYKPVTLAMVAESIRQKRWIVE